MLIIQESNFMLFPEIHMHPKKFKGVQKRAKHTFPLFKLFVWEEKGLYKLPGIRSTVSCLTIVLPKAVQENVRFSKPVCWVLLSDAAGAQTYYLCEEVQPPLASSLPLVALGGLCASSLLWPLLMSAIVFLLIWVRATLPRDHYDQFMRLGWITLIVALFASPLRSY